ncbi:TetR/AcrR family transcriptional regulator [Comamonas aquatilis]|uniref:TetR/AcrR family transcriptional regulator n=1 Tax=Comamonas aquatilis TaxID=1778406 RepID=UPI0039EF8CC6
MQESKDIATPQRRGRGRPPKSAQQRNEGNRRNELILAAGRQFRLKGFHGTSTRDIAAAAGMQSSAMFYFFESKEAMLHEVMRSGMDQAMQSQSAALAALGSRANALGRLRALVRNHLQVLVGPDSDFIPVMLYEWRVLTVAQRLDVSAQKDLYEGQWMPALNALHRTGRLKAQPEIARLLIFGALNWTAQWYSPQGSLSLDALTTEALALFMGER